jgi:hypothetical protein
MRVNHPVRVALAINLHSCLMAGALSVTRDPSVQSEKECYTTLRTVYDPRSFTAPLIDVSFAELNSEYNHPKDQHNDISVCTYVLLIDNAREYLIPLGWDIPSHWSRFERTC